jgi:hypothetical protein
MTQGGAVYRKRLERHYESRWAKPSERLRWRRGPVQELPGDFEVLAIKRSAGVVAYATVCMSQPEDAERLELHVLAPETAGLAERMSELLTIVAYFHRTGARLGLGHTVNLGEPWIGGAECTHGLLSLPYLDGPALEWMSEPRVRFLWLLPITEGELRFKKEKGLEALEQRFEQEGLDYLDLLRQSVV